MRTLFDFFKASTLGLGRRGRRALGRIGCGCLLAVLLVVAALVALITLLVSRATAAPPLPTDPLTIYLLLDESISNTGLGGSGSDPTGLRHEAARLLISYLGVDSADSPVAPHEVALIHFGSTARLTQPPTALGEAGQTALLARLAPPEPMGWTDHLVALTLAVDDAATRACDCAPVLILFTDGKSDWDDATAVDHDAYLADLRAQGRRLADMGGRLFIVLLANEATDADPEIGAIWKPIWQEMAAVSHGGRFYEVRRPEDLMGVYHEIIAAITGHVVAPPALDVAVSTTPVRHPITVEPNLAGLTLVIAKSDPATVAQVFRPDGRRLSASSAGVRYAGGDGAAGQEVWQIEQPPAGQWLVLLSGAGRVLVWKDVRLASPTPTAVPTLSPTPAPTLPPATPIAPAAVLVLSSPTFAPATPRAAATLVAAPVTPIEHAPAASWLWLLLPALGAVLFLRLRRRPLLVSGALRVLGEGEQPIDLESLHRSRLTVGAPPADVVLPASARFSLAPRRAGEAIEVVLRVDDGDLRLLSVNGRPPVPDQPLRDMDIIRCGDLRLRYENLALRAVDALSGPVEDLEQLTY